MNPEPLKIEMEFVDRRFIGGAVTALRCVPGDVVVFRTAGKLNPTGFLILENSLKQVFPGNRIAVLQPGDTLDVIAGKAETAAAPEYGIWYSPPSGDPGKWYTIFGRLFSTKSIGVARAQLAFISENPVFSLSIVAMFGDQGGPVWIKEEAGETGAANPAG